VELNNSGGRVEEGLRELIDQSRAPGLKLIAGTSLDVINPIVQFCGLSVKQPVHRLSVAMRPARFANWVCVLDGTVTKSALNVKGIAGWPLF